MALERIEDTIAKLNGKWTRTTPRHFDIFKKEFNRYVELFGMKQWKILFEHQRVQGGLASIGFDTDGMAATITYSTEMSAMDLHPRSSAKHEAIHLLLAPLVGQAQRRYTIPDDIDEAWEQITRILEKVL